MMHTRHDRLSANARQTDTHTVSPTVSYPCTTNAIGAASEPSVAKGSTVSQMCSANTRGTPS